MKIAPEMLKNLLLALISTIATLVVLVVGYELVLAQNYERWRSNYENDGDWYGGLTVASSDPILMWEYRPEWEYVHWRYGTVIRTNEFGFRQKLGIPSSPPAGTRRIAFIGDSVTLGMEVQFEQTFSQVTERMMNSLANSVRYEALNFGIDGYNTPQILRQLTTKVLRYSPDLVIYSLCLNDFDFEDASAMKIRYFRKPENFFLEDLAQVIRRFSANGYHTHYFNQNKEAVFEDIATMQAAVQKRGINLLVLILPVFKVESFDDYYLEPVHEEIIREMRARRIDVIDTLSRFRDSGLSPQIFAHDVWHMKAKGHDLVGQTVAELLMQSLPISP